MAFTYFFRDSISLEHAVSFTTAESAGSSKVRVWDAGCAMGPEPYTLAMLFAEKMGMFAFKNLSIDATDVDISNQFGEIIESGCYPREQLERIPKEIFGKYFQKTEKEDVYIVERKVRERLHFHRHDLLSLQPVGSEYRLIVCKNVLLHFSAEQRLNVLKMYHNVLCQNGMIIMEQTQKMPVECESMFEQVIPEVQLYRKKVN